MCDNPTPSNPWNGMKNPQSQHRRYHFGDFESCWYCARSRAICRSKIPLLSLTEAIDFVDEFNDTHGYVGPVVFYFCGWCNNRHMKTAKTKQEKARAEKARRAWLIAKRDG